MSESKHYAASGGNDTGDTNDQAGKAGPIMLDSEDRVKDEDDADEEKAGNQDENDDDGGGDGNGVGDSEDEEDCEGVEEENEDSDESYVNDDNHAGITKSKFRSSKGNIPKPPVPEVPQEASYVDEDIWPNDFRTARERSRRPYSGLRGASEEEWQTDWELMSLEPGHPILKELEQKLREKPTHHDDMWWRNVSEEIAKKLRREN